MNLLERVRETQTLEGGVKVYQDAKIGLVTLSALDVRPTALYVLLPRLRDIYLLANEMAKKGINIFDLDEVIENGVVIGPPLVEKTDGVWGIIDGSHRFNLALKENIPVKTITVEDSDPAVPVVSFPVEWPEITEYETRPNDPKLLRRLRPGIDDSSECLRSHYRDLGYLGSLGRRPREGQNG